MDKDSLKKKLHEQIDAMDDELSLQMLHEAAAEYGKAGDILDVTRQKLKRLEKSLEQANNGNTVSHDEGMKMSKGWLVK